MDNLILQKKSGKTIHFLNADYKIHDEIVVVSENVPDELVGGFTSVKQVFRKDEIEYIRPETALSETVIL